MTCHNCKSECKKAGFFGAQRIQRYECKQCKKKFSDIPDRPLDDLRIPQDKALMILNLLVEGMSVRGCERLTGCHRDTVLRVLEVAGEKCAKLLRQKSRGVKPECVQIDECFTRVLCIEKNSTSPDTGDQYFFSAIDRKSKFIIAHTVGKRNGESAYELVRQLRHRVSGHFQITSDGWKSFIDTIRYELNRKVDYAVQIKTFRMSAVQRFRHVPPAECIKVKTYRVLGMPDPRMISTSHIERSHLTMRHFNKRFTRLTLGYSKTLKNLRHTCALYAAHFNFCRSHSALDGQTPAMAIGITGHKWTMADLLENESNLVVSTPIS